MSVPGKVCKSPCEKWVFGMACHGAQGMQLVAEPEHIDNNTILDYAIDWEVHDTPRYMNHLCTHNPNSDTNPLDPFSALEHIAEVICDEPEPLFAADHVAFLCVELCRQLGDEVDDADIVARQQVWIHGLHIGETMLAVAAA
jgi:hypothetical protein